MTETRHATDPVSGQQVEIRNDLTLRLRGRYAIGPTLPNGEPEFGWRETPRIPIQWEAAAEVERLRALVAWIDEKPECRAAQFRALQADNMVLREALRKIAIVSHHRMAEGGGTVPSGQGCESCGKVIAKGAKYTVTMDGCYLCETDAPSMQDVVDYWNHHTPDDDDEWEAKADADRALADHIEKGGSPDDKPLLVME